MSSEDPTNAGGPTNPGAAKAVVAPRRGVSPVWLIPIVVAVVAAGLAYEAIQERGPRIVILFESAEGLEAGKSKVRYRDVEIGSVDEINLHGLKHVAVHCTIAKEAAAHVTADSKWWVVRPRLRGGSVSGLETIVSGAYVTLQPGTESAGAQREFTGLEEPPVPERDRAGLPLLLHAPQLAGIDVGASVYYRDFDVGDVIHTALAEDGKTVEVRVVISPEYTHLVTRASRFWDAGGIDVSLGAGGLDVKTESLSSIVAGGVAFDSPGGGGPVEAGQAFWLHSSWADVHRTGSTHGGLHLVLEAGSLGSVAAGNPVYFREVPVGAVVSHELAKDGRRVRIHVNIERRHASLVRSNSVFWNASGISADLGLHGLHLHAESLKSLLAGGVSFATPPKPGHAVSEGSVFRLHPEAKSDWIAWETELPQDASKPGLVGRFFHHEGKTEEQAAQDDPTPEPSADEHKHGFLHRLFGGG